MEFKKAPLVLMALLMIFQLAFAGEAEPAKEGEGGEGHGESKGGVKTKDPEWVSLQNQINQLEGKIQQKKESIEKLIEEKNLLPANSPAAKDIVKDMMSEYKEMVKTQEEFDKKVTILKFRFPERGLKGIRNYNPSEVKSLEDMEKDLGTDGRLNRNQKKVRAQYQTEKKEVAPVKTESKKPVENKDKPIDEQGTIILSK